MAAGVVSWPSPEAGQIKKGANRLCRTTVDASGCARIKAPQALSAEGETPVLLATRPTYVSGEHVGDLFEREHRQPEVERAKKKIGP